MQLIENALTGASLLALAKSVYYITQAVFTRHWTNFRLAEKFDRALRSHRTVRYFSLYSHETDQPG